MIQEEREIIGKLVSNDGEILTEFYNGDSIKRKPKKVPITDKNKNDPTKNYDFKQGDEFVKVYTEAMDIIDKKITNAEARLILRIMKYISYKDGILRDDGKNGNPITIKDISDEYQLTYEGVRKQIYSLIKKGILGEHRTGNKDTKDVKKFLTVNPYIFLRGTIADKSICGLFEKSGWNK
jgi:DNA-binding MarR family transcriptional regulator